MVLLGYAIMCLIFGTTFLAIKIGVDAGLPPFFSAGVRFLAAGLILMIWMYARKKISFSLLLRKETLFIGAGLTFFTFAALYWAEQYITSGVGAVLSATGPAIILLIRSVVLKDKVPSISFIGAMIGLVGVALLMLPGLSGQYHALWVIACLVVVLGEFGYAAGAVYSKQVVSKLQGSSPIAQNAAQMMHGGWMLLVLSLITERGQIHMETMFNSAAIGSLLYLIVLGSMGGHTLFYWLISRTNPVFPSTWLYISPVIALLLGWLIYKEPLNWVMGVGALIILIGVILTNIETLRSLFASQRNKASRDKKVPIVKVYKN
ncbi:EamA family transporter [Paenibacillus sp. PK4536]|uniref:DMT family transporter n=1 Tax=Paenibacillus sp. PK4536 TaxID=3024576 RepID=UPI002358FC96|nr:EamA family transporter [Paenibacillus sp. PK4536]WIM40044.1 EamA family transporter [Paenibacillus sp. PK4536]